MATPACDPGVSQWMEEVVEGGQIRDAHELGMTSAVHSTLAVPHVSLSRICLINGHHSEGRLLLQLQVRYSEKLMAEFSLPEPYLKHKSILLPPWILNPY